MTIGQAAANIGAVVTDMHGVTDPPYSMDWLLTNIMIYLTELADHPPVVGITAGTRRKIAGHRERDASHHTGASYQARATCDSESLTRIALSSRPSRPRLLARAASAR